MKINAFKQAEAESKPYLRLLDKPSKKEQRRKGLKEDCLTISFVWIISMALMAQVVIENGTIADIFSVMLVITAVLQAIGNR